MQNQIKKIILLILFSVFFYFDGNAKFGYRYKTLGAYYASTFYPNFLQHSAGISFDQFRKSCLFVGKYKSLQLEYGFNVQKEKFSSISFRYTQGIISPIFVSRLTQINPIISINISYLQQKQSNNINLRPEIGFVIAQKLTNPFATRLHAFYGYEFNLIKESNLKPSGNIIGLKLILCLDFTKLDHKSTETEVPSE